MNSQNVKTSSGATRIMGVDGMRALAMLMIFTYHVWQFGDSPALHVKMSGISISFGRLIDALPGVNLFMVLSGFCLFLPWCKLNSMEKWDTKSFYRRRVLRIVPTYYAAILFVTLVPSALVLVMKAFGQSASWRELPSIWQYVTHLTFTHTLFPQTWDGIQGAFWTMGMEAQFYLVFPLVILLYKRFGMTVILGIMVVSLLYRTVTGIVFANAPWTTNFLISITFVGRWMEFGAGMLTAWFCMRNHSADRALTALQGTLLFFASILLFALSFGHTVTSIPGFPLRDILIALSCCSAMICVCSSRTPLRHIIDNKGMAALGFMSFSICMLHQNTIYYFGELLKKILYLDGLTRFAVMMTVGLLFVIGVAYPFFRAFELPFIGSSKKKDPPPVNRQPGLPPGLPAVGPAATQTAQTL